MSRSTLPSEPGELLRQLAQEALPSSPEDSSPARRDRLVRQMKDAVERTAEKTEKARRFRRVASALAAAASFALLGGMWLHERGDRTSNGNVAGLTGVSGTVVLTQEGRSNVVAAGERALHDGDALQTAAGARAHVKTAKADVNVSESTELRVSRPSAAEERISLRRGRVDVEVDKAIETKRAVVVETPDAEVVVRGTVFDVRVEPLAGATNTRVHVTRGSVWVLAQGVQVALLSAGQSWSSAAGVDALPVAAPAPVAPPARPVVAPAPASVTVPDPPVSAPAHAEREAANAREPRVAAADSNVGRAGSGRKVVGTLSEENRLFAAGVEARNRGDHARAAELFAELLSSYPQSTLREVAQVERFRALRSAGQETRAVTEARRYLAEHPDGAARGEARDLALDSQKK